MRIDMSNPKECPEKKECLSLKGKPIGMYHCSHCGEMLLAGEDSTKYCPLVNNEEIANDKWVE